MLHVWMCRVTAVPEDDHALLAEALAESLRRRGVTAQTVHPADAAALLAVLTRERPDLVLLDLDLGTAVDSLSVIRSLRGFGIRILLMTGCTDRSRITEAIEQGEIGWVPKTADFDALFEVALRAATCTGPFAPEERGALLAELMAVREHATG